MRVDTGHWADIVCLDRTDRLGLVCKSLDCVQDEQHFGFDCPAYSHIRSHHMMHLDLLQHCCFLCRIYVFAKCNQVVSQMHVVVRDCFACRKQVPTV